MGEAFGVSYDAVRRKMRNLGIKYELKETLKIDTGNTIQIPKTQQGEFIAKFGDNVVKEIAKHKLVLPKVSLMTKSTSKREEFSILDLSDIHYGMVNKVFDSKLGRDRVTYNREIFKVELHNLIESIGQIHGLLSTSYSLKKLYINFLGDIITNDRIFEGQVFHIEGCAGQQIWEVQAHMIFLINQLLRYYEEIEVNCVVGNHGRSRAISKVDEPVQNNFEYHLYRIIQVAFEKEKRVKVHVPTSYEHIADIGPWKHLLLHGDKMRGSSKNNIEKQVKDLILNVGNFDSLDMGHFHFCGKTPVGESVVVKHNGCWIEKDDYAFRMFKTYSIPEQHFYGCNARRNKTWAYEIDLRW